jgi:LPS O-antigen subunit length determinant protein (WzzB/FepE family)
MTMSEPQSSPDANLPAVAAASYQLATYEKAHQALTAAVNANEVTQVRDYAVGLMMLAKYAQNREMEQKALELRLRAERKLGQMMEAQKQTVGFNKGTAGKGRPKLGGASARPPKNDEPAPPTLAEAGIDKHLAQAARNAAKPSEKEFERQLEVTKAGIPDRLRGARRDIKANGKANGNTKQRPISNGCHS